MRKRKLQIGTAVLAGALAAVQAFGGRDHHPHGLDPAEQDKIVRFFKEGCL